MTPPILTITHLPPKPPIPSALPENSHSSISKMRLAILTFVLSLLICVFAVNLEDKSNIEDITAAFNLLIDGKKYPELGKVLSPDVTYDPGDGPVQGLPAAIDTLSKIIPSTTTTYFTLGTQLIKFLPPFDKDKRSNLAESVSYSTFVGFGSGNLTGESYIFFVRFVDKEIVRTRQPGFGGWRFKNRKFELVGKPIGNPAVLGL